MPEMRLVESEYFNVARERWCGRLPSVEIPHLTKVVSRRLTQRIRFRRCRSGVAPSKCSWAPLIGLKTAGYDITSWALFGPFWPDWRSRLTWKKPCFLEFRNPSWPITNAVLCQLKLRWQTADPKISKTLQCNDVSAVS